jgi:predicted nucleic acid-binding protein
MRAPDFLDAGIIVCAYVPANSRKRQIAQVLLKRAPEGAIIISTQVLAEFASTILHNKKPPADPETAIPFPDALAPIPAVVPDASIVRRAVEVRSAYGIHFCDGVIIAAAERAGCGKIWPDDMNAGQLYFGTEIQNLFR